MRLAIAPTRMELLQTLRDNRRSMARGKYLSLKEAREKLALKQFAKEHRSEADRERFMRVLNSMVTAKKPAATSGTSDAEICED